MSSKGICVLYGSQTGQAESIAENIHEAATELGMKSSLLSLRKSEEAFEIITAMQVPVVFVCSTTGEGEVPGNARKFMRLLGRKTHPENLLVGFRYALLGLGDTNYTTFCGGPKTLERGLKRFGATSFYPTGYADDGTDLELVVEPWIEGLWPAVESLLKRSKEDKSHESVTTVHDRIDVKSEENNLLDKLENLTVGIRFLPIKESALRELSGSVSGTLPPLMQPYIRYEKSTELTPAHQAFVPYPVALDQTLTEADIISIERLTADDAVKTAYYVTIRLGSEFIYRPGDSFGVLVQNPKAEVDWLIRRLNLDDKCDELISLSVDVNRKKNLPKYLPNVTTIRQILQNVVEIRSVPKRAFLRALFDYTASEEDKNILRRLCRKEAMDDFIKSIREPNLNLLDLLASLPSCQPTFSLIIEHLPRIKSRLYSAASALEATPDVVKFVFNIVDFPACDGRMYARKGVFSGFMDDLYKSGHANVTLSVFRTNNTNFRLPVDVDRPLVMIGPGTGVSPFVGFLEALQSVNICNTETWLFFGCRHKEKDFLFRGKLYDFVKTNTLRHLVVSFSRDHHDAADAKYVQDNLRLKRNEILSQLLNDRAIFYVCGDARNMASDVRACVLEILSEGMGKQDANEFLTSLVKDGRYKEDIWT